MNQPIEQGQRALMNDIAQALDMGFNGDAQGADKKVAFVVLTARFGDIKEGRVNYISNGEREDMKAMLRELLARFDGAYDAPSTPTPQ